MHLGKVVLHHKVCRAVRDRPEAKRRIGREGIGKSGVFEPGDVEELLAGDHKGGQVGRVDGQEDEREEGPHVGHQAGGIALRAVHVHRRFEENDPDEPEGAKVGEVSDRVGGPRVVARRAQPFEEEDGGGGRLDRDDEHEQPGGEVERLEEGRRRDDPRSLGDEDRDAGLQEGDGEVDDLLAAGVDLERGEDHVCLLPNQCCQLADCSAA